MFNFDNLDSSELQNFVYSSIILISLIIGLFARKDIKFTKVIKYLGIWSIITFLIILLYSYRYNFSDFKQRILAEISPSSAQINKEGQIIINLSSDGHFYVNIKINGLAVKFMIDTGASDIAINADDARRIGIDLEKLNYDKSYQTANGKSFGASLKIKELEISDIKFYNVSASVSKSDMGVSLLGMSFLKQFRKYEFYQDRLVLTR